MTVQILKTPGGDDLVVLPRADFERLVALAADAEEELADIAAYDSAKSAFVASGNQVLPAPVSAMLLNGTSLLCALRKSRGLTQLQLAGKAGIRQGFLSDLEAGRRHGSSETLAALALALSIPAEWLA